MTEKAKEPAKKLITTITVDTLNEVQNRQYVGMLDEKTMVTRDKWKDFGVDIYMFMSKLIEEFNAEIVIILGYEGTGKSYGIKFLEPETHIWYNADRKNPTFRFIEHNGEKVRAREVYGTKDNPTKYMPLKTSYPDILTHLRAVKKAGALADNPIVFLTGHIDDYKSTDGEQRQRIKTLGNLATKMNIEGKVENCLYTHINAIGDNVEFKLDTVNSGFNNARALEDAFESRYIDNNFELIREAITNY